MSGSDNGLIFAGKLSKFEIRDSCIFENDVKTTVFYAEVGSNITISNCTVDMISVNSGVNTDSLSPSPNNFFHMFKLLNTGKCYGTFDVVEGITFDLPTPEPTQSLTPKRCLNIFTCKQNNKKSSILELLIYLLQE